MAAEKAGKSGQSKARFSRKDEFPDLSPSKQEGRRKSRSKSRGRSPSRGRSESRDRRRSPSRDGRKLWSDIARGGAKGEKDAKVRQRSRTPARKPQNNSLASKMMQLESTIKLLQETVKQQQETMKQQKELIARFTSQQHGNQSDTPWSVGTAQQTASFTPLGTPVMPPPTPSPQSLEQGKTPCQKKAHRSSVIESDEDEHLNMNTGDDETESISSISTLHSRDTDTQGGLNYGARFKHINARLNRQDKCTKEISQKVDNVASAMKTFKNDVKADFAKLEAREEARINTGFEEMKHFMPRPAMDKAANNAKLRVWHWNANGLRCRNALLQQQVQSMAAPADVIMIQETHMEETPKLPGYHVHASPPSARTSNTGAAQGVCTFVRKGITLIKLDRFLDGNTALELCATEVVVGKKTQESVCLMNAYSNPQHRSQRFRTLFHKARRKAMPIISTEKEAANITLRTEDGTIIPHVRGIRVLGMHFDAGNGNHTALSRLLTKGRILLGGSPEAGRASGRRRRACCRGPSQPQPIYDGSRLTSESSQKERPTATRRRTSSRADFLDPDPLLDYGGILAWYREGRRALPGPHPRLGRREGVLLRQLQTGTVLTPALARHVCPGLFESATCSVCARELATLAHVLWGCDACAGGSVRDSLPPDMEHYISSPDHQAQLQAIQRLDAALARQKRTEATPSS
ncbi:hypothetical protein HPB49_003299 [Dermacentor silvarum]|uniref:Uncharacterized protein n=1 Tax=Dermacentor silvarum TaxID=543639 RepID=A0ACB8DAS0_DERSI|nr:hypothetical protein HPB49_003299 [Dermacentor silvarum]